MRLPWWLSSCHWNSPSLSQQYFLIQINHGDDLWSSFGLPQGSFKSVRLQTQRWKSQSGLFLHLSHRKCIQPRAGLAQCRLHVSAAVSDHIRARAEPPHSVSTLIGARRESVPWFPFLTTPAAELSSRQTERKRVTAEWHQHITAAVYSPFTLSMSNFFQDSN